MKEMLQIWNLFIFSQFSKDFSNGKQHINCLFLVVCIKEYMFVIYFKYKVSEEEKEVDNHLNQKNSIYVYIPMCSS